MAKDKEADAKNQAKRWLEQNINCALTALHWLLGAKKISFTMKFYEDGSTDGTIDFSYAKQRKPSNK